VKNKIKTTSPQIDKTGNNDNNTKQKGPNLEKRKINIREREECGEIEGTRRSQAKHSGYNTIGLCLKKIGECGGLDSFLAFLFQLHGSLCTKKI
jgi:hypothetical protein